MTNRIDEIRSRAKQITDGFLTWFEDPWTHCKHGTKDWCEGYFKEAHGLLTAARQDIPWLLAEVDRLRADKDGAYLERNRLVALLASMFPSGIKETEIAGWSHDWHGCVYIDFPWGQASWHYHTSHSNLFMHLPTYQGEWNGHTTESKYEAIARRALEDRHD